MQHTRSDTSNIDLDASYNFTVFKAPPLLQAAKKGNDKVLQFLKDADADLSAKGSEYDFIREIRSVNRSSEQLDTVKWVTPSRPNDSNNRNSRSNSQSPHWQFETELHKRITVTFENSRTNQKTFELNGDKLGIVAEAQGEEGA